ncbi:hypothetical protein OJ967_12405 [Peribacillus frigoritolerans]|uniref:hypothetical protein n=1 Tax=Peribacillus frigoritolerans TaxID=450367 RepID=UPI002225F4AB|nr:hypothetical protein [Peribacillus frigoritolerans]UYZ01225.1 hypothetical protein OJ967_12405 [Peribacillus frigoritolerans]
MTDVNVNFPPTVSPNRSVTAGDVESMVTQVKADVEGQVSVVTAQLADTETKLEKVNRDVPTYQLKKNRISKVMTSFQNGHGFAKQSAGGQQIDDLTDFVLGNQSMKLITAGDGVTVFTRNVAMGPFDMTGKQLQMNLKIQGISNLSELTIFLFSGSTSNYYAASPMTISPTRSFLNDEEWGTITSTLGILTPLEHQPEIT